MRSPFHLRAIVALALSALALGVAACGSDDEESAGGSGSGTTEQQEPIRVGLVTDIGGLNDRGFNQLANTGLERAKKELGVEGRVITSDSNSDYIPNLSTLAQQRYDLIVAVGFLMGDATNTIATRFPQQKIAIVDFSQAALKNKPTNVQGLLFRENEAGYLAGYLAGLYAKDNDIDTISSVGGQKVPAVDSFIAGYQTGADAARPGIRTLTAYSQDFVDQGECKEIALNQLERGSGVVFAVAGQCGLGALDAAREQDALGVGVDADQSFLGPHILTSAVKRVDTAVFNAIKAVQDGTFKGGSDVVFDLKSQGVGLGKIGADGQKYAEQIEEVEQQLAAGEIDVPSTLE